MKIYHNPRCRKSRETLEIIRKKGIEPEIIEYLQTPINLAELKEILQMLNLKPLEIIRKNESEFKDNFKGKTLTDSEWMNAILQYPKLLERPIVVEGKKAVLGRPPENVLTLF